MAARRYRPRDPCIWYATDEEAVAHAYLVLVLGAEQVRLCDPTVGKLSLPRIVGYREREEGTERIGVVMGSYLRWLLARKRGLSRATDYCTSLGHMMDIEVASWRLLLWSLEAPLPDPRLIERIEACAGFRFERFGPESADAIYAQLVSKVGAGTPPDEDEEEEEDASSWLLRGWRLGRWIETRAGRGGADAPPRSG